MNLEERKKFLDTLYSLKGDSNKIDEEASLLNSTISYPGSIARFRKFTKMNLGALSKNRLFFSTSDYYNDPLDSNVGVSVDKIKDKLKDTLFNESVNNSLVDKYKPFMSDDFAKLVLSMPNASNRNILNSSIDKALLFVKELIRRQTYSICFTEDVYNLSSWIYYGDENKGFELIYGVKDGALSGLSCSKFEKCLKCPMTNQEKYLYPVGYADKPYESTTYATAYFCFLVCSILSPNELNDIKKRLPSGIWEREKIILTKGKKLYADLEWRLILPSYTFAPYHFDNKNNEFVFDKIKEQPFIECAPDAIVIGSKMSSHNVSRLIDVAKKAGIKKIMKAKYTLDNKLKYLDVIE